MTDKKKEHFKKKLIEIQSDILESIIGETMDEENPFDIDGDLADRAEALTAVAISEGLSSKQKETLEKINQALHKMKNGDYGLCIVCGKDIELDRLEAVPYADKCKEHMNNR
jgi:RNA polymerase-binding protein DksA